MRKYSFAVSVMAALCFSAAVEVAAQDAARGAALLGDARTAVGGEDRLRMVKTLDVRGDFKRIVGQTTIEGELQVRLEVPDKLRRDEDLSPPGGGPAIILTEVLNGATVWDENSGRGGLFFGRFGRGGGAGGGRGDAAAPPDPARLQEAQRRARQGELARYLLVWLLTSDAPATWVATAEAPDGKADVLEIPLAGVTTRLFLDQTSHLPLMMTWQGIAPQIVVAGRRGGRDGRDGRGGAPDAAAPVERPRTETATLRMTLGEFKTVNGIRLPHLITRAVNNMTVEEWTIDSYRINPSFRSDVFNQ